jgi:hypothetical protein
MTFSARCRAASHYLAGIAIAITSLAGIRPAVAADDLQTVLTIHNDSSEALKCVILFGHWVTQDIAEIAPKQSGPVPLMRAAKDGALYVPRFDGRHMMVERIACGRPAGWWESLGDIQLLPLREKAIRASETSCQMQQRASCLLPHEVSSQ